MNRHLWSGWVLLVLAAFVAGATAIKDGDRIIPPVFVLTLVILAIDFFTRRKQ